MVEKSITGIVTWLQSWFPLKGSESRDLGTVVNDLTGQINNKASASSVSTLTETVSGKAPINHKSNQTTYGVGDASNYGHLKLDTSIGEDGANPVTGGAIYTALSSKADSGHNHSGVYAPVSHEQATTTITNNQAYNNIKSGESTTLTLTTQKLLNDAINTAIGGKAPSIHEHTSSEVIDGGGYINFTPNNNYQSDINKAIDIAIGNLSSIKVLEFVTTLPTASASTMGMLYIINENSKINFYYTEYDEPHDDYDWHKMDTDILDELVVNWSDVQNKPSTFTPSSHTHNTALASNNGDLKIIVNNTPVNLGYWLNSNMGYKSDDIDWSYNSDGFTNGIKLESKNTDDTGKITFRLKS